MSFTISAPAATAAAAVAARVVSIESGIARRPVSASMTGTTRPYLLVGVDGLGAGTRGLAPDVDEVGALGLHGERVLDGAGGSKKAPPSEKESGVTLRNAHHERPLSDLDRPRGEGERVATTARPLLPRVDELDGAGVRLIAHELDGAGGVAPQVLGVLARIEDDLIGVDARGEAHLEVVCHLGSIFGSPGRGDAKTVHEPDVPQIVELGNPRLFGHLAARGIEKVLARLERAAHRLPEGFAPDFAPQEQILAIASSLAVDDDLDGAGLFEHA